MFFVNITKFLRTAFHRTHPVAASENTLITLLFISSSVLRWLFLTLKDPFISESCIEIKIELNFYFQTFFVVP